MDEKQAETTQQIRKILEEKKLQGKINSEKSNNEQPENKIENKPYNEPEEPKGQSNSLVYITSAVLIICVALISYFLGTMNAGKTEKITMVQTKTSPKNFEDLPQNIKERYILISRHEEEITKLKESNKQNLNIDKSLLVNRADLSASKKYNIFKCYDENVGEYTLSKKCMKSIDKFLKENSSASAYEVIGVVDDEDNAKYLKQIKNKELTNYAVNGLSRKRVVEASWKIKDILGKDINLVPVNYTITSEVSRGFVIRAHK